MHSAIRSENLVKRFRSVEAVRGLDLDVPENSTYALVGPNGAGKSTTIKILMNILRPTSGRAEVLGQSSTALTGEAFTRIGYVSENQELPDSMRVGALLSYLRPFYPTWDRQLEAKLVRQFSLPIERKVKHLSRGMQMKVALVSSLAYRPKLMILDEPFTGLDPLVCDELIQGLLACSDQATAFVSTHDLGEIESIATHVGYLNNGRLLFSEQLTTLLNRFREVEVDLEAAAPAGICWPATWLQAEISDNRVRFVDSQFEEGVASQCINATFDRVRQITFTPMSLRSIFVAVARSESTQKSRDGA